MALSKVSDINKIMRNSGVNHSEVALLLPKLSKYNQIFLRIYAKIFLHFVKQSKSEINISDLGRTSASSDKAESPGQAE